MTTPTPSQRQSLTSQKNIWMAERKTYVDDRSGNLKHSAHQFLLKDKLLRALILADQPPPLANVKINSWMYGKGLGAVLLTWFTKRALHLHRLPYHEDRLLTGIPASEDDKVIRQLCAALSTEIIDETTNELRKLYEHTQACLADKNLTHVQLSRGVTETTSIGNKLGQAGQIARLKCAAETLGKKTVQFEMDTLNSWGDDGGYAHFPVRLHRSVVAADILYCTELLANASGSSESGEWVVINRHPAGLAEFKVGDIDLSTSDIQVDTILKTLKNKEAAIDFMKTNQPLVYRTVYSLMPETWTRPSLPTTRSYKLRKMLADFLMK